VIVRALIVDDEPLSRRAVRQLLAAHPDVEVVGECFDAIEARDAVERLNPDVVFLDIRMPGQSGLDFAATRKRPAPLLVFVTAFERYALDAFDVEPVDYLTKPVVQERLDRALQRVRERLAASHPTPATQHITVRVRDRELLVRLDDVDFIEADDVYAAVVTAGRRHLVRRSLDVLARELDARFLRVHRSYLVPLHRIAAVRLRPGGRRELVLTTGDAIPVSRRRWETVEAALRTSEVGRSAAR